MSQYNGSLTREQFMFREMRIVAQLYMKGFSETEIAACIESENMFQYPTEREIKGKCRVALRRLSYIAENDALVKLLAEGTIAEAKQVALVAMMCDSRLLAEFMIDVVGEKFRTLDLSLAQKDLHLFFAQLCEKDEGVAAWSAATVKRIKSVLMNVLRENAYLEKVGSQTLLPVLISDEMKSALVQAGLKRFLPAFNTMD